MWDSLAETAAPAHVALVLAAVASAPPRCDGITVVAVDGPSGAGKSTLAKAVAEALGATLLRMDDFYPGWDGLSEAVRILADDVIAPLCRGEDASVASWDWVADRPGPPLRIPRTDLLVVDGVGSTVGAAGLLAAVRVWVEAEPGVRRARGIARDGAAYEPFWDRWAAQEAEVFAADEPRARADVLIDTSDL
jgi:predicted kinase